ncbi:hypothetical protein CgunFtcFv8_006559 [Champsocephalus gunnari]|uniref:Uncharacterized protein n=1 Tax=Champsocephalus gunnari TaxID=52237 RepID=A0AAN8C249_CHAGU|nr:hypothetical protein CgunFtcFv8_006559 [Champsocephalus gunnari]
METRLNFLQTRKDWREEQAEWLLCFLPHCLPGRLSWGGLWSSPICLSTGVNISAAPSPPPPRHAAQHSLKLQTCRFSV